MRRADRAVTDYNKMLAIVQDCDCCRLGLVDDGEAYIVPLNFGYRDEAGQLILYFHCAAEGRKVELFPRQKKVAFEMDVRHALDAADTACNFSFRYQCVMGTGELNLLTDPAEKLDGLRRILLHYSGREDWPITPQQTGHVLVLKLTVTEWSCKEHL